MVITKRKKLSENQELWCTPVIPATREAEAGRKILSSRPACSKLARPYLRNKI
jgi:hypothetical protein